MTSQVNHHTVFRETDRFAGWPANYGIWNWGNEIVLGFTVGHMLRDDTQFHLRDMKRPFDTVQARSLDGGKSWSVEPFPGCTPGDRPLSADEHMIPELGLEHALMQANCTSPPKPCPGGINFMDPDTVLMCAKTGIVSSHGVRSMFYVSTDRCRSWAGPYSLPMFHQTGVAARTAYLPLSESECLFFLTANRADGSEGMIFCARTRDGGASFEFVSHIGKDAPREGWAIMPAALALADGGILVARRCGEPRGDDLPWHHWIDLYRSDDQGDSWRCLGRPVANVGENGNPPTLNRLPDGRLCVIYGHRDPPYGIRAVISEDDGNSWSEPITLRDDAGSPDLGYPRTVVLPCATVLTAYYYQDEPEGERYIASTHWQPAGS